MLWKRFGLGARGGHTLLEHAPGSKDHSRSSSVREDLRGPTRGISELPGDLTSFTTPEAAVFPLQEVVASMLQPPVDFWESSEIVVTAWGTGQARPERSPHLTNLLLNWALALDGSSA